MTPTEAEKVAKVETVLAVYSNGEFDRAAEMFEPDGEIVRPGGQDVLQGREQIRAWMDPDAFAEQKVEALEFVAAGEKMLSRARIRSRGARSGIEFETVGWAVWTFADTGLITRLEMFLEDDLDAVRKGV